MPDAVPTSAYTTYDGVAEFSKVPSAIPILVVPDDVLKATAGPVPVAVEHEGRSTRAWAWAERAWNGTSQARGPSVPADGLTFSLSRGTLSRLSITDRVSTEQCVVAVHIPNPVRLSPVMPLIHDLPESNEVQVPGAFPGPTGKAVLIRNGVAAWVTVARREHVRPGTIRMSSHLRTITGPTAASDEDGPDAVLLGQPPADRELLTSHAGRKPHRAAAVRTALRAGIEHGLRWFFRAEEQAMRVYLAHPGDEHQHVVTMSDAALTRLGVRSGDKVVINWLGDETEVTVLKDHEPGEASTTPRSHDPRKPGLAQDMSEHLAVRVPAALRHLMHLPAASIVTIRRSTRSVLSRNLNNLIIPVASLVLAGAALNDPDWGLLTLGAIATALLGLSRLRMGSRRATPLTRGRGQS